MARPEEHTVPANLKKTALVMKDQLIQFSDLKKDSQEALEQFESLWRRL